MWTKFFSPDRRAVERVLDGDRDAFAAIVDRYFGAVKAFAYSRVSHVQDAEDVAQETFLNAYRSLGSLENPAKLGAWLLAIAANVSKTVLAARQRRERWGEGPEGEPSETADPGRDEFHALLRSELDGLDEKYRDVLVLHYFAGQTTKEIGALLGISKDAAQKRLQRGREQLGERLVAQLGDALAPYRSSEAEKQRTLKAVLALPPLPVRVDRAPVPATPMPTGVYVGVAVVGAAVVGGMTWFKVHDARRLDELSDVQSVASETAAALPAETAGVREPDATKSEVVRTRDGFVIGGTVTTVDGEPIAGAIVRGYSIGAEVPETRTDAEGRFALEGLPARAYRVRVTHEEYMSATMPNVPPGREDLAVTLEAYPSLEVQVVDAFNGNPLQHFFFTHPSTSDQTEVRSESGRIRIDKVSPYKDGKLAVWAERYRPRQTVIRSDGDFSKPLIVSLERATVISGVVRSVSGAPAVWATVTTSPTGIYYGQAGKQGEFEIKTPAEMPRRIYAIHDGFGAGYVDLDPDAGAWDVETEIRLQPGGDLKVNFDGAIPDDAEFVVRLEYVRTDLVSFPAQAGRGLSASDIARVLAGQSAIPRDPHHFRSLLPGAIEVSASMQKGHTAAFAGMLLSNIEFREIVEIEADTTTFVRFEVPEFSGSVVMNLPDWLATEIEGLGVSVDVVQSEVGIQMSRFENVVNGSIHIDGLPAGNVRATSVVNGFPTYIARAHGHLAPGSTGTFDLSVDRSTGIRVAPGAIDVERLPAPVFLLRRSSDAALPHDLNLTSGLEVLGLARGQYQLRCYLPKSGRGFSYRDIAAEWTVEVRAGEIVEVAPPEH